MTLAEREYIRNILGKTGGNVSETARITKRSPQVVRQTRDYQETTRAAGHNGKSETAYINSANIPPPKTWASLNEAERGWLTDFGAFRRQFFELETPPFQAEICATVTAGEYPRYLVLVPPGHGKSETFSFHYAIWMMLRARAANPPQGWACLMVSKSTHMAQAFLSKIKRCLEQNVQLAEHFGRFRPEYPDVWKRDALQVDGFALRKDPTFIAAGAGSHIYGWRVPLLIGDDIVDKENSSTPEAAQKLAEWHSDQMMSRLEPEGTAVMVGTRFMTFDLYGRLLRQRDDYDEPLWHSMIYKAHDDSRCGGEHCEECKEKCSHDTPYPDGCILWPGRFGYRALRSRRSSSTTGSRFEFIYNQAEVPEDDALVKPEWIEGCKNTERSTWDFPRRGVQVYCTLDPSPANWAVAQAWAYHPGEDRHYLIAQHRRKAMKSPQYLALMGEWTERFRSEFGLSCTWIVEINAAQRFLFQSRDYQELKLQIGLQVKEHTTGRNKADPDYGVQALSPLYEFGKVDLPWKDPESRREIQPLIDELISYPGETTDCVMANWFEVHNCKRLQRSNDGQWLDVPDLPGYLYERRTLVDMRAGTTTAVKAPWVA